MHIYFAMYSHKGLTKELVTKTVEHVTDFIPDDFREKEPIVEIDAGNQAAICLFVHKNWNEELPRFRDNRSTAIVSGYLTLLKPSEYQSKLGYILNRSTYAVDFSTPVGGIYSLLHMSRGRKATLSVSQSRSGVEAAYITNANGIVCVSNRAIVSHIGAFGDSQPNVSHIQISGYLESMYSINNQTPYLNTYRIPKDQICIVSDNGVKYLPRKIPSTVFLYQENIVHQAEVLVEHLKEACKPLRWYEKPVLRISGGKDSRLLLALLTNLGIDFILENHNQKHHKEAIVARSICETVGYDKIEEYIPIERSNNIDELKATIVKGYNLRGGLPNSVPLHYPFDLHRQLPGITPLVLGHAHHLRGGYARSMLRTHEDVMGRIRGHFESKFFRSKGNLRIIEHFISRIFEYHPLELLYWAYSELRVPNYLSVHYAEHMSFSLPVYPLLDENMITYCDFLANNQSMFSLMSEKLIFAATKLLSPEVLSIPLYNDRYRFEAHGKSDEPFFGEGYECREPSKIAVPKIDGGTAFTLNVKRDDTNNLMREIVLDSELWQSLSHYYTDEFITYIEGDLEDARQGEFYNGKKVENLYALAGLATLDSSWGNRA